MKCKKCQSLLPSHYKKCPVCGYSKLVREEFAPQPVEEVEEKEAITPFVESGDTNDFMD